MDIETLVKNDWDHIHDCILDATWETTKKKCTKEELIEIFNKLPEDLKYDAFKYGMNCTVWRDTFIKWYKENYS